MGVNGDQVPRFPASEVSEALGESVEFLGSGTFGDTWRAGQTAVKIICLNNQEARLKREIEGLSRVRSRFVVKLLETFTLQLGGALRPALRFEFIQGGDLADRILHEKWPTVSEAESLLEGLLLGADALHKARTIHRDIKPGNIALRDGSWSEPVLLDLGLAKPLDATTITIYPGRIGTPMYMAPEQLRGTRARKAADLWAIGVTVRQLMNQSHPFYFQGESLSIDQALQKLAQGPLLLPETVSTRTRSVLDRLTAIREYDRGSTGSNLRILREVR
jgi:eukaryotic-like serine/threonine-protein kinase